MQKRIRMGKNDFLFEKLGSRSELFEKRDELYVQERGLFIPKVENETPQERANRILAIMDESNDRLHRVLTIFDKMKR